MIAISQDFGRLSGCLRLITHVWPAALVLITSLAAVSSFAQQVVTDKVLRTVAEVRGLSREQAMQNQPVHVRAMVTHWNPSSLDLFVQDETGGIFVAANSPILPVTVGKWIEVKGITSPGGYNRVISRPEFISLDNPPGAKISPSLVSFAQVLTGKEDGIWLQVRGVVQSIVAQEDPLVFWIRSKGQKLQVVTVRVRSDFNANQLLNAEVLVSGVCSTSIKANGELDAVQLLVNDSLDLHVERRPEFELEQLPVQRVAALGIGLTDPLPDHAVCLHGRLEKETLSGFWNFVDSSGTILVRSNEIECVRVGYETRVAGFLSRTGSLLTLDDAVMRQYAFLGITHPDGSTNVQKVLVQVVSDTGRLRTMQPEDASQGYPVFLRGVVTVVDPAQEQFCVQDNTGGVFIVLPGNPSEIEAGKIVEVEGVTGSGTFMPVVKQTTVRVVGEKPIPEPAFLSHGDLLSGLFDGHWISLEGIIRAYWKDRNYLRLRLAVSDERVTVRIPLAKENDDLSGWVDSKARITGVLDIEPNLRRQPKGFGLLSPGLAQATILERPNQLATPLRKIRVLGSVGSAAGRDHRIRVQGVVTHREESMGIFMRDQSGSILVRMEPTASAGLAVGDQVEVAGFVGRGDYADVLEDAAARRLASGSDPLAAPALVENAAKGIHDHELIRIEGDVVNHYVGGDGDRITLQDGVRLFEAQLTASQTGQFHMVFQPMTRLALSGVCVTEIDLNGRPRGFRLLLRSWKDCTVLSRPSWWSVGRILWVLGTMIMVSITALGWVAILRRQVQERTQQTKKALAMFEASLTQSPSGIIIAEAPEITVRWANPAASDFCAAPFPISTAAGLGRLSIYWHGYHPDGAAYQESELPLARAILRNEVTCNEELILRNAKGEDRWVSVNAAPIHDGEGKIIAGIMVFHDITSNKQAEAEREQLQTQLAQAHKMESVGRLAGGVAHDFNNMLQVIIGNVSLAMEQTPTEGELCENLNEIQKAAHRSADLTRQLLAFARKQIVHPKVLDLNEGISRTVKLLRRLIGENIELAWIPGDNIWPVLMDLTQLDQVLANLTVNARDAISGTGRITIETSNVTLDEGYARTHAEGRPGDYAMLAVSDSGLGMSKDTQAHLFEPFFTTKGVKGGTGLGLATIYGIVKQNSGLISVYSEIGKGTTFKIYLPRIASKIEAIAEDAPSQSLRGTETILLVEDEEQVLKLGQRVLTQHGYTVLTAGAPGAALTLAGQDSVKIDLMITDVIMPGMNGKELRRQISKLQPGMKCLFMSGYTANVIAHHGVLDDGIAFLQKPFTIQTLTTKVREVLASDQELISSKESV